MHRRGRAVLAVRPHRRLRRGAPAGVLRRSAGSSETGFQLKGGEHEGGPGGGHDGTFVQDWAFVAGLGDLDACNGVELEVPGVGTTYAYVLTDTFPFVPRYTVAEQDETFRIGPGPGGPGGRRGPPGHRPPPPPSHGR